MKKDPFASLGAKAPRPRVTGAFGAVGFTVLDCRNAQPLAPAMGVSKELLMRLAGCVVLDTPRIFSVDPDDRTFRNDIQDLMVATATDLDDVSRIDFNLLKNYNGWELSIESRRRSTRHDTLIIQMDSDDFCNMADGVFSKLHEEHENPKQYRCGYGGQALCASLREKAALIVGRLTF